MRSSEPKVVLSNRYTITETSQILGIHRHTLREYTEKGLIRCGFRRANCRKDYLGSEILRFWRASK